MLVQAKYSSPFRNKIKRVKLGVNRTVTVGLSSNKQNRRYG